MTQNGSPKARTTKWTSSEFSSPLPTPHNSISKETERLGVDHLYPVEPTKKKTSIPTHKPRMPRFPNPSPGTESGRPPPSPQPRVFLASKHPDTTNSLGQLALVLAGPSVKVDMLTLTFDRSGTCRSSFPSTLFVGPMSTAKSL